MQKEKLVFSFHCREKIPSEIAKGTNKRGQRQIYFEHFQARTNNTRHSRKKSGRFANAGGCLVVAVVRMLGSAASLCEEHTGRLVDVSGVAVNIDIGHVGGVASDEVIEEASVVIGADINAKVGGVGAYAHGEVADRLVES